MKKGEKQDFIDLNNLKPWNSNEFPVKINNIRCNQDNSLFNIATSKGYKIFSAKSLKQVHEMTEKVRDLGDLQIVMTYYCTSLVFFLPTINNENYTTKELILFDDYQQKVISSFKSKHENIMNFYVGKYAVCIILEKQILIIELMTFKIIYIISNIYSDEKLSSFNAYGFIAYIHKNEKYNIYIKLLNAQNNKIVSIRNKILKPNFEHIQSLHLSPSGQFIALSSLFGNKIHVYYVENLILKECFYLGDEINNISRISFPSCGENFLFVQFNKKKLKLFELSNITEGQFKCKCYNYKNEEMLKEVIKKKEKENGLFNYFKNLYYNYNNPSIEEKKIDLGFICIEVKEGILFSDFNDNKSVNKNIDLYNKEIVIINGKGFYYKYSFNRDRNKIDDFNEDEDEFKLINSVQWI